MTGKLPASSTAGDGGNQQVIGAWALTFFPVEGLSTLPEPPIIQNFLNTSNRP
ncbi:hypothetical protein [Gynuella sunshinyii]|uniref:Uncharacterized protein n=1 Tax=Gynuella sunshinyii YC6258 TaxID=1445510 RepID=A0A0C5VV14_9GAMM|nr:hypothetical protein [Gynuella sunshinyii]AJQ97143.1 hypothetical Protein YC6258_05113 [Gynuella sunshinyii YC6258]